MWFVWCNTVNTQFSTSFHNINERKSWSGNFIQEPRWVCLSQPQSYYLLMSSLYPNNQMFAPSSLARHTYYCMEVFKIEIHLPQPLLAMCPCHPNSIIPLQLHLNLSFKYLYFQTSLAETYLQKFGTFTFKKHLVPRSTNLVTSRLEIISEYLELRQNSPTASNSWRNQENV